MSIFQVCRICLAVNVRMFTFKNTDLHYLYEIITSSFLNAEDGKPVTLCYICHARLKKCSRLREQAIKSNEVLEQLLKGCTAITQGIIKTLLEPHQSGDELRCAPTSHVDLQPLSDAEEDLKADVRSLDSVKNEPNGEVDHNDTELSDNTRLEEYSEIGAVKERQTDSEDDVPLIALGSRTRRNLTSCNRQRKKRHKEDKEYTIDAKEIELTEDEQKRELLERAKSENYLNSPYKCDNCYKGFVDPQAFSNHMKKHDQGRGAHECGVCRLRYASARQLRAHALSAHSRRYVCARCPHRSHTRHQARDHEKWHDGYTYPCRICGQKFQKPTSYLTHVRKRHSQHACARCGDSFAGRHGLRMHVSKTHGAGDSGEQEEASEPAAERYCERCDVQFVTLNAWKRHILTSYRHTVKDDSSACEVCGAAVTSQSRAAHARSHVRELRAPPPAAPAAAAPALPCAQCDAQFVTRSRLQAHVKRVHLGLKYDRNVVCEVCGKKCTSGAALRAHQRRHTGERPFACAQCPARFAERARLRLHARTHSGERPYACAACHKRFSQKPALNRHYRVHSGARPYACAQCAKRFTQSNSLKLHVRSVHMRPALQQK